MKWSLIGSGLAVFLAANVVGCAVETDDATIEIDESDVSESSALTRTTTPAPTPAGNGAANATTGAGNGNGTVPPPPPPGSCQSGFTHTQARTAGLIAKAFVHLDHPFREFAYNPNGGRIMPTNPISQSVLADALDAVNADPDAVIAIKTLIDQLTLKIPIMDVKAGNGVPKVGVACKDVPIRFGQNYDTTILSTNYYDYVRVSIAGSKSSYYMTILANEVNAMSPMAQFYPGGSTGGGEGGDYLDGFFDPVEFDDNSNNRVDLFWAGPDPLTETVLVGKKAGAKYNVIGGTPGGRCLRFNGDIPVNGVLKQVSSDGTTCSNDNY